MELIDRFAWHMENVEGVVQVITLPAAAKIVNAGWNDGSVRWRVLPRDPDTLRQATQSFETDSGLLNADCSAIPVTVFTADHQSSTIDRVVKETKAFREANKPAGPPAEGEKPDAAAREAALAKSLAESLGIEESAVTTALTAIVLSSSETEAGSTPGAGDGEVSFADPDEQFSARGTFANGSSYDVTREVTWSSSSATGGRGRTAGSSTRFPMSSPRSGRPPIRGG